MLCPVAVAVAVTLALGTTAPVWSVTAPVTVAVMVCALVAPANQQMQNSEMMSVLRKRNFIIDVLVFRLTERFTIGFRWWRHSSVC